MARDKFEGHLQIEGRMIGLRREGASRVRGSSATTASFVAMQAQPLLGEGAC